MSKKEETEFYDRPKICAIDLPVECIEVLKSHHYDCYDGTLGPLVKVPNERGLYSQHYCLLNCSFPRNLHEYDIVIIDLQDPQTVVYNEKVFSRF